MASAAATGAGADAAPAWKRFLDPASPWSLLTAFLASWLVVAVLWWVLAWPSRLLIDLVTTWRYPDECRWIDGDTPAVQACARGLGLLTVLVPLLLAALLFFLRRFIARLLHAATKPLPPTVAWAAPAVVVALVFALAWAGPHRDVAWRWGIVPAVAFPAAVGLVALLSPRYGPALHARWSGLLDRRDKLDRRVLWAAALGVPVMLSLVLMQIAPGGSEWFNLAKEELLVALAVAGGWLLLTPRMDRAGAGPAGRAAGAGGNGAALLWVLLPLGALLALTRAVEAHCGYAAMCDPTGNYAATVTAGNTVVGAVAGAVIPALVVGLDHGPTVEPVPEDEEEPAGTTEAPTDFVTAPQAVEGPAPPEPDETAQEAGDEEAPPEAVPTEAPSEEVAPAEAEPEEPPLEVPEVPEEAPPAETEPEEPPLEVPEVPEEAVAEAEEAPAAEPMAEDEEEAPPTEEADAGEPEKPVPAAAEAGGAGPAEPVEAEPASQPEPERIPEAPAVTPTEGEAPATDPAADAYDAINQGIPAAGQALDTAATMAGEMNEIASGMGEGVQQVLDGLDDASDFLSDVLPDGIPERGQEVLDTFREGMEAAGDVAERVAGWAEAAGERIGQATEWLGNLSDYWDTANETAEQIDTYGGLNDNQKDMLLWVRMTTKGAGDAIGKFMDGLFAPVEAAFGEDAAEAVKDFVPVDDFVEEGGKAVVNTARNFSPTARSGLSNAELEELGLPPPPWGW